MITRDNTPISLPTFFCSCTLLPFSKRKKATSAWPSCAALRSSYRHPRPCHLCDKSLNKIAIKIK